jgi:acetyl-CoA synthetase
MPKDTIHVHEAVLGHYITGYYALDSHEVDVFWCTSDPGWVTGTSYGIISPLVNGVTMLVDEAEFEPERWYRNVQDQKVTSWYTSPTAIRMLMKAGSDIAMRFDLSKLRFMSSVGEPLNPEAVVWSQETFGKPFHDNWWQTETGGIMIANFAAMDVRPGSMGWPLPGIKAAIVTRDSSGAVVVADESMTVGELALEPGWPSMFRGYLHNEECYKKSFASGWYQTGDLAMCDEDGYYWFVGRADDMIKSSGHLSFLKTPSAHGDGAIPRAITQGRHSRLLDPMTRSTRLFCQGGRTANRAITNSNPSDALLEVAHFA